MRPRKLLQDPSNLAFYLPHAIIRGKRPGELSHPIRGGCETRLVLLKIDRQNLPQPKDRLHPKKPFNSVVVKLGSFLFLLAKNEQQQIF